SVLGNVSGVDMNNTITFRSTTGNRDDVHITNTQTGSGDNYVLRLTNISYVTFKHITLEATGTSASYTTVLDMWDTVSNITIDSCRIKARVSTSTSSSGALVYARGGTSLSTNFVGGDLSFTNNDFWGGGTAIYLYGASTMLVNAVIENNTIDSAGAYGVYLYYTSNIKLRNNS